MVKVFLEAVNGSKYELSIDDFFKKTKEYAFGKVSKEEAKVALVNTVKGIFDALPSNEMSQVSFEIINPELTNEPINENNVGQYLTSCIFQDFITYYAKLLSDVLCQKILNIKYVKATGNPAYSDLSLYGMYRDNDGLIIKSFIFCSLMDNDSLYVSTTCGTGGTAILFQLLQKKIEDKSFDVNLINKVKNIKLDSIENENTIGFYAKIGFYKKDKEANKILKDLIKKIYGKKKISFVTYINNSSFPIGGELYWSPYPKELKKLKASYVYDPLLWYKKVSEMKKQGVTKEDALKKFYTSYSNLKGAGFFERP